VEPSALRVHGGGFEHVIKAVIKFSYVVRGAFIASIPLTINALAVANLGVVWFKFAERIYGIL
jgi:hypothetical protein